MDPNAARQLHSAMATNPATVDCFLSDIPTTEPVEDYVTDIDERCSIFKRLQELHREHCMLMPTAKRLGFVLVAPISNVRQHLETFPGLKLIEMCGLDGILQNGLHYLPLNPHPGVQWPPSTSPQSGIIGDQGMHSSVLKQAKRKAKERDGDVCLFSGTIDPAAAPIFRFKNSKYRQYGHGDLYICLEVFWGAEKAKAWWKHYGDSKTADSPVNYISLNHQLQFWLGKARFALKPLRQTPTTITVQWHWLRRSRLGPEAEIACDRDMFLYLAGVTTTVTTTNITTIGTASTTITTSGTGTSGTGTTSIGTTGTMAWGSGLAHRESGVPIDNGQTFVIRAEKPEDLPSFEMLELQWNLLRIAAICGVADAPDENNKDLDDYDYVGHD